MKPHDIPDLRMVCPACEEPVNTIRAESDGFGNWIWTAEPCICLLSRDAYEHLHAQVQRHVGRIWALPPRRLTWADRFRTLRARLRMAWKVLRGKPVCEGRTL